MVEDVEIFFSFKCHWLSFYYEIKTIEDVMS